MLDRLSSGVLLALDLVPRLLRLGSGLILSPMLTRDRSPMLMRSMLTWERWPSGEMDTRRTSGLMLTRRPWPGLAPEGLLNGTPW